MGKTVLCFNDALYRADILAARAVEMAFALNASVGVDDIDGVAFGDGFGRAVGQTSATRNAVVLDFHSHSITLLFENDCVSLILIQTVSVK